MRQNLTEDQLKELDDKLPKINDKKLLLAFSQAPRVDINDLWQGKRLGVALVCLQDALDRFHMARGALHEAHACIMWYRKLTPKAPVEMSAVFTGKFYADYVALILYAVGEDIAAFIIDFLTIQTDFTTWLDDARTKKILGKKKVSSKAAKVGLYLKEKYPNEPISKIILQLKKNPNWDKTMDYRNTWVHNKPPIIHGLGIQYNRKSRVNGSVISFGGGSEPDITVDGLLEMVHSAVEAIAQVLSDLGDLVIKERERLGEQFDFDKSSTSFTLF